MKTKPHYKKHKKAGLPPGSLIYTGDHISTEHIIECFETRNGVWEKSNNDINTIIETPFDSDRCIWINVIGLNEIDIIKNITEWMSISPLHAEDILNVNQRPKIDIEEDYIFAVIKYFDTIHEAPLLVGEQFSILLTKNILCTFQEKQEDQLNPIKQRLLKSTSIGSTHSSPDMIFYEVLVLLTDNYSSNFDFIGDIVYQIEGNITTMKYDDITKQLNQCRSSILLLKKSISSFKEGLFKILGLRIEWFADPVRKGLFDVHDHLIQLSEMSDTYREITISLKDLHTSLITHELNVVMKTLTIISTFFIPLTFLVCLYGLNFK